MNPSSTKPIAENKYISDDIIYKAINLADVSNDLCIKLENRLSKVMRKYSDCGESDCKTELTKKDEDYPEYFANLKLQFDFIRSNFYKIQDMLDRLEI